VGAVTKNQNMHPPCKGGELGAWCRGEAPGKFWGGGGLFEKKTISQKKNFCGKATITFLEMGGPGEGIVLTVVCGYQG